MRRYPSILIVTTVAVLLACIICAYAAGESTITSEELDSVFTAIKQNNWKLVEKNVLPLRERSSYPQRYLIARLRYIYLFSLAAQIESKELKYADLQKKLSNVENRLIIQPWHPVNPHVSPCFNQICAKEDNPSMLITTQANGDATQIYSFEYFDMGSPINIDSFRGQQARLGGILYKIEINENLPAAIQDHSGVSWYFRLFVKDAFIDYQR